ncbi:phosphopantetheine-binding protein [Bradyrhizobium sp. Ash2021]|jgi:acyl carrier protein|uniref:phosphopantetheine-binding protein n=1 Tax=Bradyrhizobium sp. Ash2021 TaxID=2954771 RepID=UPI002814D188|nr:phosphopantetheine-binding protein [Bradyrhizobium sp. Ash2021]WMT76952.1 phosphopantetheine-binding protein [Bradyrhizobium sp. Ash2021]
MKSEIITIIADFLGVPPEQLDDYKTIEDLNIDSLDFFEIAYEIEEKFDAPVTSELQRRRDQIHNLGDILRLTEELIVKYRESNPAKADG